MPSPLALALIVGAVAGPIPPEYDPSVVGLLREVTVAPVSVDFINTVCDIPKSLNVYGCYLPASRKVIVGNWLTGEELGLVLQHELAHANGWTHNGNE